MHLPSHRDLLRLFFSVTSTCSCTKGTWVHTAGAGGWRLAAVGGWRLVAVGGWRLVAVGGWRLAVGGPLGRSLRAILKGGP